MTESTTDESQAEGKTTSSQDGGGEPDGDVGISDDQLPEDLQPTDENPLAKPPSDDDDDEGGMSLGPDGPEA